MENAAKKIIDNNSETKVRKEPRWQNKVLERRNSAPTILYHPKATQQNVLGYQSGLQKKEEQVISAHFMHGLNEKASNHLYSKEDFDKNIIFISEKELNNILSNLKKSAENFASKKINTVIKRAKQHYKDYNLSAPDKINVEAVITELLLDKCFFKGKKTDVSREDLYNLLRKNTSNQEAFQMIIPALPNKRFSPLKSHHNHLQNLPDLLPDLAEVALLCRLYEITYCVNLICKHFNYTPKEQKSSATFTIIGDGNRFTKVFNETPVQVRRYQDHIEWWINKLGFDSTLVIKDYETLMHDSLSSTLKLKRAQLQQEALDKYKKELDPIFAPYNMHKTLHEAIKRDPFPDVSNEEGRFVPLLKSIMYSIRYTMLPIYTKQHDKDFDTLYRELTQHIFEPYTQEQLSQEDASRIKEFILHRKGSATENEVKECLRESMLTEIWEGTQKYMAQIKGDRDLNQDPIASLFPQHIRWTIHAKPGQLALRTPGDKVQAWHGSGVLKKDKKGKESFYLTTEPALTLESEGYVPVMLEHGSDGVLKEFSLQQQPIFYTSPNAAYREKMQVNPKASFDISR